MVLPHHRHLATEIDVVAETTVDLLLLRIIAMGTEGVHLGTTTEVATRTTVASATETTIDAVVTRMEEVVVAIVDTRAKTLSPLLASFGCCPRRIPRLVPHLLPTLRCERLEH